MARLVCITSNIAMSRKNGTILLKERGSGKSAFLPVVQTSEIFALCGAEPDWPLLSLLSQYAIPLHIFDRGSHVRSYLPTSAILSGKTALAQVQHLENDDKRWKLARELLRGGARLRAMAARIIRPGEKDEWEERYLDCLTEGYGAGLTGIGETLARFQKLDDEFIERERWSPDKLEFAEHLARAVILSALPKLSLDPWIGILRIEGGLPPLASDMFFLFSPLLIWLWPQAYRPCPSQKDFPENFRRHLARPAAANGARIWSLRYLPVREGYSILSHITMGRPYRCVSKVEVKPIGH